VEISLTDGNTRADEDIVIDESIRLFRRMIARPQVISQGNTHLDCCWASNCVFLTLTIGAFTER
jgi:hypothetical protein